MPDRGDYCMGSRVYSPARRLWMVSSFTRCYPPGSSTMPPPRPPGPLLNPSPASWDDRPAKSQLPSGHYVYCCWGAIPGSDPPPGTRLRPTGGLKRGQSARGGPPHGPQRSTVVIWVIWRPRPGPRAPSYGPDRL
jgi:hypothetical protein